MKIVKKGTVVSVSENVTTIITEDGTFKNLPRTSNDEVPVLGESLAYTEQTKSKISSVKYASIAAVFILAIISYLFLPFTDSNAAYIVAVDINPSIEIKANKDHQILSIEAQNLDGERLIEHLNQNKMTITNILEEVLIHSIELGYIAEDETALVSTTIIPLVTETLDVLDIENVLKETAEQNNQSVQLTTSVESEKFYEEAKAILPSVNQYSLYKEFKEKGVITDISEVKDKSIREMKHLEKEKKKNDAMNNKRNNEKVDNHPSKIAPGKNVDKEKQIPNPNSNANNGNGPPKNVPTPASEKTNQAEKKENGNGIGKPATPERGNGVNPSERGHSNNPTTPNDERGNGKKLEKPQTPHERGNSNQPNKPQTPHQQGNSNQPNKPASPGERGNGPQGNGEKKGQ
ncbi:proline-rich domain-containing protein [Bacillus sp. FJAT-45350]|uniref:proline-rich domain-containing protein n=1 Tax=Bacillus sp. FJAT-45350 TaxID=2011014 RepID=UPI000BB705A2|nr:hypothetical protein [Bacillus sp. FJAT-45350]